MIDPTTLPRYGANKDTLEEFSFFSIGVAGKTARFFVLHTRPNVDCAVLDTHILRWMGELGFMVPKSTPTGKRYAELEEIYLAIARLAAMEPAKLDITLWNWYAMSINPTEGNAFVPTKKWLRDKLGGKITVDALLKAV